MRRSAALLSLLLLGCVPDLSPWQVARPTRDADVPRRDGEAPRPDGRVPGPPDCSAPLPVGAGYAEDFEAGPAGWGVGGERSSWALGTPSGEVLDGAASGSQAWATGLAGPYNDEEDSYLVSPCFDASDAPEDLLLTVSRAFATDYSGGDGLVVEMSLDGGERWEALSGSSRLGWYAFESTGWSGRGDEGAWRDAATLLEGTAGQPRVQFRFRFRSGVADTDEGVAIDHFRLRPSTRDLELTLEEAPRCGHAVARVRNVGGLPVTGYEVSTDVDGDAGLETFDRTLDYLQETEIELGAPLARAASARVFSAVDTDPSNDSGALTFSETPLSSSGFQTNFESDDGGLVVMGRSSWEWGEPAGTLITRAASGARAWVTNLDGEYGRYEDGAIVTPCFDMRGHTTDPQISMAQAYRTEDGDYAVVEMSIDGDRFRQVGSTRSGGTNWYDAFDGWTGSSGMGAWRTAEHPLEGAAGHQAVRIRIRFVSDADASFDGFAVDDLGILP